jgi:hypothetical protein
VKASISPKGQNKPKKPTVNNKKNQTRLNRRNYISLARTATLASLLCVGSLASAQTAVMLDGRVLTQKVPASPFATEGPIWNVDLANQGIIVTGRKITIPATIDGTPLYISGSSALGKDGEAHTGIGAANFRQLADIRAIGEDRNHAVVSPNLGPKRLGATRSIFSTTEGRRSPFIARGRGLLRNNVSQTAIEQNYFQIVQQCYPPHAAALPADFLDRAGLRNTKPETWTYPVTAGGTLKSAGHVYVDAKGKEYFVPDIEVVIELAENVAQGVVTSMARGNATRPDSFVMGDLLLIFNQDPRFSADVLGLGDAVIPREEFFRQVVAGETNLAVIGHTVGEHVIFVQEVLTEFIDPNAPIHISADRFRIRVGASEARWIGTVTKPQDVRLVAVLIDTSPDLVQTRREFDVPMAIDPLTGGATYSARIRGAELGSLTHIEMQARNLVTDAIEASEQFDILPFLE